ncbi:MAG TPA: sulfurtransferase TusA family protein [Gemmatimonadales bacterium]|nr:sulfurtransferase TusA family protein [Gemmatimonadales bacterium]
MTDRIAQSDVAQAAAPAADAELDCKGLLCPLPVYRTSQALSRLQAGQVLRVQCTDPGSLADFPALARQRGLTLVSAVERDGVQVFYLRKEAE